MNCYELITIEPICGFYHYYYFTTWQTVRNSKKLAKPIPDKMRILIDDRYETLIDTRLIDPLKWIYRKYFKKRASFHLGQRIDWEKEEI